MTTLPSVPRPATPAAPPPLLTVTLPLLLIALWGGTLARSQVLALQTASEHRAAASAAQAVADGALARRPAELARAARSTAALARAYGKLPPGEQVPQLYAGLRRDAQDRGVTLTSITRRTDAGSLPGTLMTTLGITASGTYPALAGWLREIGGATRILRVQSVQFQLGNTGVTTVATVQAFNRTGTPTPGGDRP